MHMAPLVVQLAINKGSILGSSQPNSISCFLQNYVSQVVCCMNRDSEGTAFHSYSKCQVLHTSVMALACDLLSFWHKFDIRIKLALDSSSQWKLYDLPLYFLNGFFTTKPRLNDHVSHLQDL